MKTVLLLLAITAFSCSNNDETCGTVTQRSVTGGHPDNQYTLTVDGKTIKVNFETYKANPVGSNVCL
jgi:hypothetical protein